MNIESVQGSSDEVRDIFNSYIRGLHGAQRKQIIKNMNHLFPPESKWLEDFVFSQFLDVLHDVSLLTALAACVDGPSSCIVTNKFAEWIPIRRGPIAANLSRMLVGWAGHDQVQLLQAARLIQSIATEVPSELKDALIEILTSHHEDSSRDLTTVVGYLLVLHFPEEDFDRPFWRPLPRMSVARARSDASVSFFAQFMEAETATASDIHYGIQSLNLYLQRLGSGDVEILEGEGIMNICLLRWDHPLHMVSANCRALFNQLCSKAPMGLLELLVEKANASVDPRSKKRFNLVFALLPYLELSRLVHKELVNDLLASLCRWSPCVTSAGGLLEAILQRASPEIVSMIVNQIDPSQESLDFDQLLNAFAQSGRLRKDGIRPLAFLVETLASEGSPPLAKLRLAQYLSESLRNDDEGISIEGKRILTIPELNGFVLSCDSQIAAVAVSVVLRSREASWRRSLIIDFLTRGGVETVSCSKDDRSVVVQEFKRFFDRKLNEPLSVDLFDVLWRSALRPVGLEEESLVGVEVISSLREGRLDVLLPTGELREAFIKRIVEYGLTSRWRKVRAACRIIMAKLDDYSSDWIAAMASAQLLDSPKQNIEEEVAGVLIGILVKSQPNLGELIMSYPITDPNIALLTGVANNPTCMMDKGNCDLIAYLLAVMVLHSQTVGESCLEAVFSNSGSLLREYEDEIVTKAFKGKVDCRGHPIVSCDSESSTVVSVKAWTCAKSAALALRSVMGGDFVVPVAKIIAVLLLSVKHPAEIAPLEVGFSSIIRRLSPVTIDEELLLPLVGAVTGITPGSVFPLPAALRRSQGLGPLISSLVKAQGSVAVLSAVIERLLSIVNSAQDEDEQVLHSMNVLRAIVRDSSIPDSLIDSVLGDIMLAGIGVLFRLSSDYWRIRSSATQLFVQSARRFIGTDNEGEAGRKKISGREFFFNRTGAGERLLGELVAVLSNSDSEFVVVPILSVLQSLANLGELESARDGPVLLQTIHGGLANKSAHVRRLAAKIISKLNQHAPSSQSLAKRDWNTIHGHLCLLSYCSHSNCSEIELLLKSEDIPEIVFNQAARIAVEVGIPVPVNDSRVIQWILTLTEEEVEESRKISDLVFSVCENLIQDPVGRELVVAALWRNDTGVPHQMSPRLIETWLSSGFSNGLAALLRRGVVDHRLVEWIKDIDLLSEDCGVELKISLAESLFVREQAPSIHGMLLLDESAEVRKAASIDGLNAIASFELLECDNEFFCKLLREPLEPPRSDSILEYCLRTTARDIAARKLTHRGFPL